MKVVFIDRVTGRQVSPAMDVSYKDDYMSKYPPEMQDRIVVEDFDEARREWARKMMEESK